MIALPVLYAACNPNGAPLHLTTWFEESKQMALPLTVCIPFKVKEELLRSINILLPTPGAKDKFPDAVAPPERVVNPVTPRVEERVVAFVTPSVPAIEVSPLKAVTLNLLVLILKSPVTPKVVVTDALFKVAKLLVERVVNLALD